MQASVLRNILTVPTMIALAVAVLLLSSADTTKAGFGSPAFSPNFDTRSCNMLPANFASIDPATNALIGGGDVTCAQNNTSGAAVDVGVQFDVTAGDHNYNQGLFVTYSPQTFAADAAIADGTLIGGLKATLSLGLTNNVCGSSGAPVFEFIFFEGTTNTANGAGQAAEGTTNRWDSIANDGGDSLPSIADPDSDAMLKYPDFLITFLNGASPLARYVGLTQVPAGGTWQMLQVLVFDPATLRSAFNTAADRTHPFARMVPGVGTLFITLLNDPTATTPSVEVISDFCSPLEVLVGLTGVATNPVAAGNHFAGALTQSIRDNDSDGFDDGFDTCPFAANIEDQFGPAYEDGPLDHDNFDTACDPTPAVNTGSSDHDGDGFANAQDNCPAFGNAAAPNSEPGQAFTTSAPDGGPGSDGMGDDCETDDFVANGGFFQVHFVDSNCIGTDSDDDGWCDTPGIDFERTNSLRLVAASTSPAPNNDTADSDGDGVPNGTEVIIGTDPSGACALIKGHDAWPPDFDMNNVVNTTDVFQVLPPTLGSSVGGASFTVRADLSPNGVINTTDVFQVLPPTLGSSCVPS